MIPSQCDPKTEKDFAEWWAVLENLHGPLLYRLAHRTIAREAWIHSIINGVVEKHYFSEDNAEEAESVVRSLYTEEVIP